MDAHVIGFDRGTAYRLAIHYLFFAWAWLHYLTALIRMKLMAAMYDYVSIEGLVCFEAKHDAVPCTNIVKLLLKRSGVQTKLPSTTMATFPV